MRRQIRSRPFLGALLALVVLQVPFTGTASARPSQQMLPCNGTALVNVRMVVSATQSWQDTYVPIENLRGAEYLDGAWTVNRRTVSSTDPLVDASGYDRIAGSDNALPGERNGGLIGRASGSREVFWVGNQFYDAPFGSGTLQLAINDALDAGGLSDNA